MTSWACSWCTYLNTENFSDECEMCERKKLDLILDQKPPPATAPVRTPSPAPKSAPKVDQKYAPAKAPVPTPSPAPKAAPKDSISADCGRFIVSVSLAVTSGNGDLRNVYMLAKKLGPTDIDKRYPNLNGFTALIIAVRHNSVDTVRALLELKAGINVVDSSGESALNHAVANEIYDCTEIARVLLSKGADYSSLEKTKLPTLLPDSIEYLPTLKESNLTLQYWLTRAREIYRLPIDEDRKQDLTTFGLQGVDELQFGIVGERRAVNMIINAVNAFYATPRARRIKPLVFMLPGPPGHGKTYFTRNLAHALVGKENLLEIACGGLRDDAELFGSNLGGMGGCRRTEGKLVSFLRSCEDRKARSVIFLDEFEKINGLTSALGWDQCKKIYQGFLEPWQEGTLSDASSNDLKKIQCNDTIFICTTNLGQSEILEFCNRNAARLMQDTTTEDEHWLQSNLVAQILIGQEEKRGVLRQFFYGIDRNLEALVRRISKVVPFLPLSDNEALVVADSELRQRLSSFRSSPIPGIKMVGDLIVRHDLTVCKFVAQNYNRMLGASSLHAVCDTIEEKFVSGWLNQQRFKGANIKEFNRKLYKLLWLTTRPGQSVGERSAEILFQEPGPLPEMEKKQFEKASNVANNDAQPSSDLDDDWEKQMNDIRC